MKCCFKRPQTLAIIGNGFDLNHGYNTDYKSFVSNTHSHYLQNFKNHCEKEDINTWYSFEENIRIISEKYFFNSMSEDCDFDHNREEVRKLSYTFKEIHNLLKAYLSREISSKPMFKKSCIEKHLNENSIAINFNYTNTAEIYTKNIVYVHGSLAEDDILLGYDYRDEPCLAQYEDIQWSKSVCRESLSFRRYFIGRKKYNPKSQKYQKLISGLTGYQHWENTGRGLDDEVKKYIPKYRKVHKFLKKYRSKLLLPQLNYKRIKTIVILGHGIEADKVFLKEIIEKCINIEKVVIYRYDGEREESSNRKTAFFTPYCKNIETVDY